MRVAFLVSHFPLLSETFILNQITGLVDRGHTVDIYTTFAGDTSKVHPDVAKYRLLERTYYLPEMPENLAERLLKGLKLLLVNFPKAPLKLLRSLNVVQYRQQAAGLWLLYAAIPALRQVSYDIVHCQFGTLGFWGMAFRQINAPHAKLFTTFRGYDISTYVQEKGEHIYDRLFQRGDFFLANCEFFRQYAIRIGCNPDQIQVHGSGIDCNRFTFKPRYPAEDGVVRIATTGRLVEKKGIEYSIRAVAKLLNAGCNLEYIIIGQGELRDSLERLIQSLGAIDRIHLVGQKSQPELIEILDRTHIFVAASVTAKDGNQDAPVNVLKEAMAMGLPVISTLHGGIPELVQDGISGFLVPERDADALADRLQYLIAHPECWRAMGEAGRAYVEAHYDTNRLNDRLVALYQQVTNAPIDPALKTVQSLNLESV